MIDNIKVYTIKFIKNIEKIIGFIVFVCTFTGAWFLFSYANTHGVKFIDLIQTSLLISYGAFSFFIIIFIIVIFISSFYFSPVIAKHFYINILIKENTGRKKKIVFIYLVYFLLCGILAPVIFHKCVLGTIVLLLIVLIFHFLTMSKVFWFASVKKTIVLLIYTFLLLVITYSIFTFLSITLNFKIEGYTSFNGFIQAISMSFITVMLAGIGLADVHRRKKDIKKRILSYAFFSLIAIFYIATAFSSGVSEQITRMIGLGYRDRCYYKKDIDKYSIPDDLIQKQKDTNKVKVFVIADIDGKMYISKGKEHSAFFYFMAKELSEIYCDN